MAILVKNISWGAIVRLGCKLSDHCGGEKPLFDGVNPVEQRAMARWEFTEAMFLGRRCPFNWGSIGGREAALGEATAVASPFAWLNTKQKLDQLQAQLDNETASLRSEWGSWKPVEEIDQFLHSLVAFAEADADWLEWQSATSGARIICVRKTRRSSRNGTSYCWVAEFHDGHKPSNYAALWAAMREDDDLPEVAVKEEVEATGR